MKECGTILMYLFRVVLFAMGFFLLLTHPCTSFPEMHTVCPKGVSPMGPEMELVQNDFERGQCPLKSWDCEMLNGIVCFW